MSEKTKAQLLADIEALKKRLAELQAVKAEPHQKNDIFKKQAHTLGERVKELNCLFGISSLVETPGISLAEILQGSTELLPPAGQYPQIICARITLDNQEYKTKNFRETKWKLAGEIKVEGKRAGIVEIFYLEKQPKSDQDSFLKEEHTLINAVAEHLGRIIQRVQAQMSLLETSNYLESLITYANAPIIVWDPSLKITCFNRAFEQLTGYSANEVLGKELSMLFPEASQAESMGKIADIVSGEHWESIEIPILHIEGKVSIVLWNSANIYAEDGVMLLSTIAQGQDITERVQARKSIAHLTLVLRAIRNVNQLIIREKNRDVLIREVCDTLTETRGYSTVWIMLLDERGKYLDSTESGLGKGFTHLLKEMQLGNFPACVQQALEQPSPAEIIDPSSTCADCPITDKYSDMGRMTIRLEHAEKVYGVLSVSFGVDITVDEEELSLFEEVAGDIAFALQNIELEENIKQAAQNLQVSEEYQKTIFETTSLATVIIEEDTTLSMVNKEFEKLSGYSKEELEGKMSWTEFVSAKDLKRMKDLHQQRRIDPDTTIKQYEFQFINREGIERNILLYVDTVTGTKKSVASLLDITKLKTFTQELQQERDKAQKYLDIAEVMIVALNEEGEITLMNQKGASILGYQIEELIGKNWYDTCSSNRDRGILKNRYKEIITGRTILSDDFEESIVTRSGEERIINWHGTLLWERDEEKRIIGILSSGEDITERVHAEKEIMSLSKFPDENPNPVLRFSKEGKILYSSRSSAVLLNKWGSSVGKNVPPNWKKKISKSFTSNENLEIEEICEGRTFSFILSPIKEMDYVNAYGRDITKRVRSEQLLDALNQAAVAMGTSQTHQEIFNAVAQELKQLDISCVLLPLDEVQGELIIKYVSFESALLDMAERFTDVDYRDFSFPVDAVDVFREVIKEKKALFRDRSEQILQQILPKSIKKLSAHITKIVRAQISITTPLIIEDKVIGLFSIQSDRLTQEDIPAATAFADQLSSAWNKVGLVQNLRKTVEGTIHTIAATVEARDPYTAGHQKRVAYLSAAIASEMHLSDEQIEGIKMAGVIHDLGKVQIPAEILSKPGKISELEYKIIQTHPQVGFDLLKNIEFPWPIAEMVLQHHEKMDGSGYPQGLKGDEILLEARILAVADTVEAMSSHRPYRPALGIDKALKQIKQDKGTLLDPKVVDACLKVFEDGYKLDEG